MKQNIVIIIFTLWLAICLTKWCSYDGHLENIDEKLSYILEDTITMEKVNVGKLDLENL